MKHNKNWNEKKGYLFFLIATFIWSLADLLEYMLFRGVNKNIEKIINKTFKNMNFSELLGLTEKSHNPA